MWPTGFTGRVIMITGRPERARRLDLGIGGAAARVPRNDHVDLALLQQAQFGVAIERSALLQQNEIVRPHALRRVDEAGDVVMLGHGGEGVQFLPAKGEEHASRRLADGERCGDGGGRRLPFVAGFRLPGGTDERGQRDAGARAGDDGVGGDARGVGMGGVDHRLDRLLLDVSRKTVGAAEAADARRDGLRPGRGGASGERQGRLEARIAREEPGQRRGFRGAAEDENAHD